MIQFPLLLTLIRLLVAPVVTPLVLIFSQFLDEHSLFVRGGITLFIVMMGLTDFFDGYFARRWNQVTVLGKLLDPLADKLFVMSIALTYLYLGAIPLWWVLLVLGRELVITTLREIALAYGFELQVSAYGKAKTACQIGYLAIIPLLIGTSYASILTILALVSGYLTLQSAFLYIRSFASQSL